MLRKFMATVAVVLIGLFAVPTVASASPSPSPYPPTSASTPVGTLTSVTVAVAGGVITITAGGFLAGEPITITITYGTPSGLRSTKALHLAAAGSTQQATADASGSLSTGVTVAQAGTATITARGDISGHTVSQTITVLGASETTEAGTTTVEPATTTTTADAAVAGSDSGTTGSGLASTGVSIAGPLTVGAGALLAGLGLLFFGTRLAIRRKAGPSPH